MEITSFILGILSVIVVITVVVIIIGMVKIAKLRENLKSTQQSFDWQNRDNSDCIHRIHDVILQKEEMINLQLEEQKREIISYIDSRIDKLQSKKEAIK